MRQVLSEQEKFETAAAWLKNSHRAVALTGAGISTPSGIPDFRSQNQGLWNRFDPIEVASIRTFHQNPRRFFDWFIPLLQQSMNAQPNSAHLGLAKLEQVGILKTIITQNIDGLHHRAGSKKILEVHGSVRQMTCTHCHRTVDNEKNLEHLLNGHIPHCSECNGILKPDVILFGEPLPAETWENAMTFSQTCDVMLVIGSSLEVMPVAGLPLDALDNHAKIILINRTPTYLDNQADFIFREDLAIVVPKIVEITRAYS